MAHAAVADGIRIVAATPHVRDDYPTTAAEMERGVAAVRQAIAAAGLSLDLRTGGEIALDRLGALDPVELSRFGLGGKAGYLLLGRSASATESGAEHRRRSRRSVRRSP